ncbi:ABC transporter ATP-binding protein [Eupransor demetentiae]|uniref:Energy-coupling factor transporter ATP-binding protein EcfA2 (EcfA2) n=1 Tax=Eupransor demetentiae TaxID=3109584 RepID=A0ABM9N4A7_9LACO|nr:Energy-coupling factor transporter ATP-binding protein EcfA2 (EcfA2) [Lactobacillaceae bacterium LMG 33000]
MTKPTALKIQNLTFRYHAQQEATLRELSFEIPTGSRTLIAGASGSGKSTLAALINGLLQAGADGELSGDIYLKGKNITTSSLFERSKQLGTILQNPDQQFVGLTAAEDIAFALENDNLAQVDLKQRVQTWAKRLQIEDLLELSPQVLSGGQKQRVALAGVLAEEDPVLLLDEPLAALDPLSAQELLALLDELQAKYGLTIIIIEHRLEEVLSHRLDQVLILDDGDLVYDGDAKELLRQGDLKEWGLAEPAYLSYWKESGLGDETIAALLDGAVFQNENNLPAPKVELENSSSNDLLKVDRISQHFGQREVLKDISFTIKQGELLALVGGNGSGKSTLAKLLAGYLPVQAGQIDLSGKNITGLSLAKRGPLIGYVHQNPELSLLESTVWQELALSLSWEQISDDEVESRIEKYLRAANLWAYRHWPISALSFGQKKRLAIVSQAVLNSKILILDEPTAGQDAHHIDLLWHLIRELQESGTTIIMISHDVNLIYHHVGRLLVLQQGKLVADTTPSALFANQDLRQAARLVEPSDYTWYQKNSAKGG